MSTLGGAKKIVRVLWCDAEFQARWEDEDVAVNHDLNIRLENESVGFLVVEAPDRLVIAQSRGLEEPEVADRLVIPMSCVIKVEVIQDG